MKTRRIVRRPKHSLPVIHHGGKDYSPVDPKIEVSLSDSKTEFDKGDEVFVTLTDKTERFGTRRYLEVTAEGYAPEMWLERYVPESKPEPKPAERACLVNVLTGERTYGRVGEDPENLFERLYS